ncbi:MAG: hypothetical protein KGP27_19100 [Hyphomicrobiales bacterium]|nr:hypothetical protein [Hyphomicrobiales bacterium]
MLGTVALAGCSGGSQMSLATGALPALGNTPSVNGTPVTVYERLGRGALTCWFGAKGPLTRTHQFSAEVGPTAAAAGAEITLFEKDLAAGNPRSTPAYRIRLAPEGPEHTRVDLQNLKLPSDLADAMRKDVVAWSMDKESCEAQVARPPPPDPVEPPPKRKRPKPRRA